ncbi:ATP-dependent Clp protease ATP-binding subunit ClpX [Xenorhabdus vietnamensis]|uniref:ATP-dependent Clp protease ATP-binding subunit ClpX n=1 Tax=Xenorhabdus vietnamensis TaxID=351656 RepID=A0A1Y2S9D5_9GAMM|nr:ClpX C4-type zinc finger protein [Xenorhabdus vietnamensis]OTA14315.1 ATP-dependent Clp protease ATP-binding subunit ClpX [Xenorhabdus vietnamensis]
MSPTIEKRFDIGCNFCGKINDGTHMFVAGLYGYICSPCITLCVNTLALVADGSVSPHPLKDEKN